jgi:hypothetical protein
MAGIEEAVAAPGVKATVVVSVPVCVRAWFRWRLPDASQRHPPRAEEHESKRDGAVVQVEKGMVGSMQELRIQTVMKNREFDERVRALQSRIARLHAAREIEVSERNKQYKDVETGIQEGLDRVRTTLEASIIKVHNDLERDKLRPIGVDATALEAVERQAYEVEVPRREEELSGPLVRRMLAERQAFELDNAKVRAREKRMVERFEKWDTETRLRHEEEAADRFTRACVLREAMAEGFGAELRSDEQVQVWLAQALFGEASRIGGVRDARVKGDEFTLGKMAEGMETLQRSVLENFGGEAAASEDE